MNLWATSFSAVLFLCFTFLISFWLGPTLHFALTGMAVGAVLVLLGLMLTRWESQPAGVVYTLSRCLALLVVLDISARLDSGPSLGGQGQRGTTIPDTIVACDQDTGHDGVSGAGSGPGAVRRDMRQVEVEQLECKYSPLAAPTVLPPSSARQETKKWQSKHPAA